MRNDPRRFIASLNDARVTDPGAHEAEDLVHGHDAAFHAHDLLDAQHLSRTVRHARDVDHDLERGNDLLADGLVRKVVTRHEHEVLESMERVPRPVGVERGERSVVPRVHGLEHVQHLVPSDLTDHDPVGPHAERVPNQLALRDRSLPLDVGGPRLQAHHVRLLELELRGILDGDDALAVGDVPGKDVQQGGLTCAGTA